MNFPTKTANATLARSQARIAHTHQDTWNHPQVEIKAGWQQHPATGSANG
jgi:hypothetical protein